MYADRIKKSIYRVMNLVLTALTVTTLRIGNTLIEEVSDLIRFKFHSSSSLRGIEVNQVKIGTTITDGVTFISPHGGATNGIIVGHTTEVPEIIGLTTTERDALTAYDGMIIFNETTDTFQQYWNGNWYDMAALNKVQTFTEQQTFEDKTYFQDRLHIFENITLKYDDTTTIGNQTNGLAGIHLAYDYLIRGGAEGLRIRNSGDNAYKNLLLDRLYIGGDVEIRKYNDALLLSTNSDCAPRITYMTTTQRDALTPQVGMIIYNATLTKFQYYNGAWRTLATFEEDIKLTQNKKLTLDSDLDSYIYADADDSIKFYTGGGLRLTLSNAALEIAHQLRLGIDKTIFLDNDLDSYIKCSADDILKIATGNAERVEIKDASTTISNTLALSASLTLSAELANTDEDTTPTIVNTNSVLLTNTNPTTITDFDDGIEGQKIHIRFADGNTTITDGTHIHLSGGANKNFVANDMLVLVYRGTEWYQTGGEI